jgi:hypothetical protein
VPQELLRVAKIVNGDIGVERQARRADQMTRGGDEHRLRRFGVQSKGGQEKSERSDGPFHDEKRTIVP